MSALEEPLAGIPGAWLVKERRVYETNRLMVVLHPNPCCIGHLYIYAKKFSHSIQGCDKEDLSAIGFLLPVIKRAVRIVTGFRCFALFLRSGPAAWSEVVHERVKHVHFELVPTLVQSFDAAAHSTYG